MRVRVETGNIRRVERMITPPMRQAITLTVSIDGKPSQVDLYICTTAFAQDVDDKTLVAVAGEIAWRLNQDVP